jgi:hypothetical protein
MSELDKDIEQARELARLAWMKGDPVAWFLISCVCAGWRLARYTRWAR